jgi:hypothetical protein
VQRDHGRQREEREQSERMREHEWGGIVTSRAGGAEGKFEANGSRFDREWDLCSWRSVTG